MIQLAHLLGRTPSSVARKLGNFGAFDPLLAQKGITGLAHYSKADKDVWDEFYQHWDTLVEASQAVMAQNGVVATPMTEQENDLPPLMPVLSFPVGPTSQPELLMTRLYQSFFRCVLHDKAYDRGLMAVSAEYEIRASSAVKASNVQFVGTSLAASDKHKIKLPSRFAPKPEYLAWHFD